MLKRKPTHSLPGLLAYYFGTFILPFGIVLMVALKAYHYVPPTVKANVFNDWSDGRIAYASNRDGNWDLYMINPDGTENTRLTATPGVSETHPSWSPDGKWIAFQSESGDKADIEIISADGKRRHKITDTRIHETEPVFSPVEDEIAFTSDFTGDLEIYLVKVDGTGLLNLSRSRYADSHPSWSPDGSRVYYLKSDDDREDVTRIFSVPIDGGDGEEISGKYPYLGNVPSWDHKGKRAAFEGGRLVGQNEGTIYVGRPKSIRFTPLMNSMGGITDSDPCFSPDGSRIVFARKLTDGNSDICVINRDGTGYVNLTIGVGSNVNPSWGRDPTDK